jgi:dipeptidyl aminopeptidase/acylaminoacyl peptidase
MRPFLSPDALSIYYCDGSSGHIFEATRQSLNDQFGNIQHLSAFDIPGSTSNHPDMAISSDGASFYFVVSSAGQPGDIYVSYLVPEPATLLLLGFGAFILRKKNKN